VLSDLQDELERLRAAEVRIELDDQFEPRAGTLARVEIGLAYWHLLPTELQSLLAALPDGAGSEKIRRAIECRGSYVWHGPAPPGSRDTSHEG
jgi:hypothetical protein